MSCHLQTLQRYKCINHIMFRHSRGIITTNACAQSHHVQTLLRYKCMCPVTSCSDTPEVQMHVPSHIMFRHSRGTNACAQSCHAQIIQRYKCMFPVTSQSLSHNGFQHKAACGKVGDLTNGSCGHQKPVESHVPFASSSLLGLTQTLAASFNMEATSFKTVTSHWPLVIWKSVQLSKGCVTTQLHSSCDWINKNILSRD